jgi:hypothetical protein
VCVLGGGAGASDLLVPADAVAAVDDRDVDGRHVDDRRVVR